MVERPRYLLSENENFGSVRSSRRSAEPDETGAHADSEGTGGPAAQLVEQRP